MSVIPDDTHVARASIAIVTGDTLLTAYVSIAAEWIWCIHAGFVDASIHRTGFTVIAIFVTEATFWIEGCRTGVCALITGVDGARIAIVAVSIGDAAVGLLDEHTQTIDHITGFIRARIAIGAVGVARAAPWNR